MPKSPFTAPGRPAGVRARRSSPTTPRCASISGCTTPRFSRAAIWPAPISPSRRRASAPRCSRCGRRSTTPSSPRRCCRSSSARSTATLDDLDERLQETTTRVREGAALPGEAAAIEATLLQQRQQADALRSSRRAALARLVDAHRPRHRSRRGGRAARDRRPPRRRRARRSASARAAGIRSSSIARATTPPRQQAVTKAADRPQLSAFGRAGYGRPGLNFISDQPEGYALGRRAAPVEGVELGHVGSRTRGRSRSSRRIVSAEEAAFTSALRRAIETDLAAIDHLEASLPDRRSHRLAAREHRPHRARAAGRRRDHGVRISRSAHRMADRAVRSGASSRRAGAGARPRADDARAGGAVMRRTDSSMAAALIARAGDPVAAAPRRAEPDAYGNVEATEVVVGAEATGRLVTYTVAEGAAVAAGAVVGDDRRRAARLRARSARRAAGGDQVARQRGAPADCPRSRRSTAPPSPSATPAGRSATRWRRSSRSPGARTSGPGVCSTSRPRPRSSWIRPSATSACSSNQIAAQDEQIKAQERQIAAQADMVRGARAQEQTVAAQVAGAEAQVSQAGERIRKTEVRNPIDGTVLTTYAKAGEVVQAGQPLYRVANLDVDGGARLRHRAAAVVASGSARRRACRSTPAAASGRRCPGSITWISSRARVHADADSDARRARRHGLRHQDSRRQRQRRAEDRDAGRRAVRRRARRRDDAAVQRRTSSSPNSLEKRFGATVALNGLSFSVARVGAVRLRRSGRRRQDHAVPDSGDAAGARERARARPRPRRREGPVGSAAADRLHARPLLALSRSQRVREPALLRVGLRHDRRARTAAHRADLQPARAVQGSPRRRAVGRHETEAGALLRAGASAGDPVSRRADHRRRRRVAPRVLGSARRRSRRPA